MSIKTKIAALALAAVAVTGSIAATTTKAEAYPYNWGYVGAGLATAAIVGTAIAASNGPVYYTTYRRCGWQPRYNVFGQYMGSVRVCTY
jgi:hypothetical protein